MPKFTYTIVLNLDPEDEEMLRERAADAAGGEDDPNMSLAELVQAICDAHLISNIEYDDLPLHCEESKVEQD